MTLDRRTFVAGALAVGAARPAQAKMAPRAPMYGLIGRMRAVPGRRDALAAILIEDIGTMPGCLSYIVAADAQDADAVWITEVWDSADSHRASLKLPAVRAAIAKAAPIIAGFDSQVTTVPLGGYGLTG